MLAYAFRSIKQDEIGEFDSEEFSNMNELFSEIIIQGMRRQLKRGLPKGYINEKEELSNLRGKIDLQTSNRKLTNVRHHLVCDFDELTEDIPSNRLIKCAITILLKQSDVSKERKHFLKFLRSSLENVTDIRYHKIPPQRTGGAEYVMLINICRFLLEGLLSDNKGDHKMRKWLPNEEMSALYERFLLEYFKLHYPKLNPRSSYIEWDIAENSKSMPKMRSDVHLSFQEKTLIIDAKFYNRTMVEHYDKKIYHSNHLYQIYTYVKNEDRSRSGNVSGMLLYAKTDEDITPDSENIIGGNTISVKTIDLTQNFIGIRTQLDKISEKLK